MATPIRKVGLNEIFPMLEALEKEGADENFVRWIRKPGNAKLAMALYRDQHTRVFVQVPDLPAEELIKLVNRPQLDYLDDDFETRDFIHGERGKTYEVLKWSPGDGDVTAKEVREHFKGLEAEGSTAAFIAWLAETNPEGNYLTIPPHRRIHRDEFGHIGAPYFDRNREGRFLGISDGLDQQWSDDATFVAFREVK